MINMNKLKKAVGLSISALTLLFIGGIPTVHDTMQNAVSYITMPISHADNSNTFDLTRKVTSKQFTVTDNDRLYTFSTLNRQADDRVDSYLRSVRNLRDYQYHISKTGSIDQNKTNTDQANSETATITFSRK